MMHYLMKCGHVSNGTCNGEPACVICTCFEVIKEVSDTEGLEGRFATCRESKYPIEKTKVASNWSLPFFQYQPDKEYDNYYDGSWGWD